MTWAALLTAGFLRWLELGKQSLWFDEGYTAWFSSLSVPEIVRALRIDTSPPLYYILEHYWANLFGDSELALRALSAFFGTLSLAVFYLLAKKLLRERMAVALAMWLFALSTMQIWYSREARFYEILSFLSLLSSYFLILFLEKRRATLFAGIVLSVAASLYIHNMMFFYLLALSLAWLIYPSERTLPQRMKEAFVAALAAVVLYLPWVPSLLTQVTLVRGSFWAAKPTVGSLFQTMSLMAGLNSEYLPKVAGRIFHLSPQMASGFFIAGTTLLCAVLLSAGILQVNKSDRRISCGLLIYCVLPILLVFLLSQVMTSVYIHRVFIGSSFVLPILFASALTLKKKPAEQFLYRFLAIVLFAMTALSAFAYLRYEIKEDWRGAINYLLRMSERERVAVFVSSGGQLLFDYYRSRDSGIAPKVATMGLPESFGKVTRPARRMVRSTEDLSPLMLAVNASHYAEIDLVLTHEFLADPKGLTLDYLKKVCLLQEERRFHGVTIVSFLTPAH